MIDNNKFIETETFRIHETKGGGTYGIKLLEEGKTVACAYIKRTKNGYKLYRVFVEEKRRGSGLGKTIMSKVIENFGELDIHLCAYPNRISDYEERKYFYINQLFRFYESFGFKRIGETHSMVRNSSVASKIVNSDDLFE